MAKHITPNDIEKIKGVLDGWDGKLTWDALCDRLESVIGTRPTRQTLNAHDDVKAAFLSRKESLKSGVKNTKTPQSLAIASQRISRLENENIRLKEENSRLLQQFIVWQYNAFSHGLTEAQLNNPLPPIDRESSEE